MGVHFVRWVFTQTKEPAEDGAAQPKLERWYGSLAFAADPQPVPAAGIVAITPEELLDTHLEQVTLYNLAPNANAPLESVVNAGTSRIMQHLAAAAAHVLDTTTVDPLADVTYYGSAAVEVPVYRPNVRLSGNALTSFGAPAPTSLDAAILFSRGRSRSSSEFGGFVDDTADTLPSVANTSSRLMYDLLRKPSAAYTVESGGRTATFNQVAYTAPAPTGDVFVRNSQIGSAPNQIPPQASNNTPERYAFHPCVFVRRPNYMGAIEAVSPPRTQAITASRGVLPIWQVVRAPTFSRWLLILDGVPRVVFLAHPAGSDLRTPGEIWNGLLAPMVASAGTTNVPIYSQTLVIGGSYVYTVIGQISGGQIRQLDYARFLGCFDGDATSAIVALYTQVA